MSEPLSKLLRTLVVVVFLFLSVMSVCLTVCSVVQRREMTERWKAHQWEGSTQTPFTEGFREETR